MKTKQVLTVLLLIFMVASVGYAVSQEIRGQAELDLTALSENPQPSTASSNPVSPSSESPATLVSPSAAAEAVTPAPNVLPSPAQPPTIAEAAAEKAPQPSPAAVEAATPTPPVNNRKLIVYYFHGNVRCYSCNQIEALTKEAIETGFRNELAAGQMELQVLNFQKPANEHFIKDYQITNQTVVLQAYEGDQPREWKKLDQVWLLLNDRPEFLAYIKTETKQMLRGGM